MTDEQWSAAVDSLRETPHYQKLGFILEHCKPEVNGNALDVRVPGGFYTTLLRTPEGVSRLCAQYGVKTVNFLNDSELEKAFKESRPAEPVESHVVPAEPKPVKAPEYKTKNFSIEDNLSARFHPGENKYFVTEENGMAYRRIERMLSSFPNSPEDQPVMIYSKIGRGKTHLMQHFAWTIKELIEKQSANTRVRYISAEDLVDEHKKIHRDTWRGGKRKGNAADLADAFSREREDWYSGVEWLFLDDIHAFAKGERVSTLEWVYKISNRFIERKLCLVSSIDTPPQDVIKMGKTSEIRHALERLFSRLYSGGTITIEEPKSEDLVEIVNYHLHNRNNDFVPVPVDVFKGLSFFTTAKSPRDAISVAQSAYQYSLEGMPLEKAIERAIDGLKRHQLKDKDLFTAP